MKKKFKLKWYYWVLIIFGVVAIVASVVGGGDSKQKVSVEKAQNRDITETVSSNGKIQPEIEVKIAPEVSGEIVDLYVKEGDSVKQGQLLVRINPDLLQSDLERNRANLNNSRANYANAKARLAQLQARMKAEHIACDAVVRHGQPAETLIRLSEEYGVRLIVVGRRGQSSLKNLIFGSVSGKLIQTSPIPVVVVP